MPSFAATARQADTSGLPVVEGITFRITDGASADQAQALAARVKTTLSAQLGGEWDVQPRGGGWMDATPATAADLRPPSLDRAWDAVRVLSQIPGVVSAEPLLLLRVPSADEQEVNTRLGIWGIPYDPNTEKRVREASAISSWSLQQMKVPEAWARWRVGHTGNAALEPGHGIRISHPDTGYTLHPQVSPIRDGTGKNYVEVDHPSDALDDLTANGLLEFPGHGTGTASVLASPTGEAAPVEIRSAMDIQGIAPGARVRPLRVSTSVVHLSFHNLVLALEESINSDAHVVSMSLGGPLSSEALRDVVQRALDAGIIIAAAAGNYLPSVVFPAALPGVIACAASNAALLPWRFSGFGDEVAITAPGERVWHATVHHNGAGEPIFGEAQGDGTSFSTAAIAGLAALWLSYHGRDHLITQYGKPLLPFAFYKLLQRTASSDLAFIHGGKGGFGAGIANADQLLQADLPGVPEVKAFRTDVLSRGAGSLIDLTLRELAMLFHVPTHAPDGSPQLALNTPEAPGTPEPEAVRQLVEELLGGMPDDPTLIRELAALIASGPLLQHTALGAAQHIDATAKRYSAQHDGSSAPSAEAAEAAEARALTAQTVIALRRQLLHAPISPALRQRLTQAQDTQKRHPPRGLSRQAALQRSAPPPPTVRRLRAFAFDPSLAIQLETAAVNAVTIPTPFEVNLEPGPVGEYLEVVDVDPATGCAYPPVDLNSPTLLAEDGLPQSEGDPQFHQQMAYAVAMKTIGHFEKALGRPIFWSPLRPWRGGDEAAWAEPRIRKDGKSDLRDQFIRRLRLYPHALREANAYYSPAKRAILFGYFPAQDVDPGREYPGGMVFTCLSHDIIGHEMTHAILDGMHVYFTEPSNPDVFAFHEAFADIVALFQHFTYPEVLRDQIARTRGDLTSENLLGQLAQQFGAATGEFHALRDAIGGIAEPVVRPEDARTVVTTAQKRRQAHRTPAGVVATEPVTPHRWVRYQPDPFLLPEVEEAHARGAILVAAVFDAFLSIYARRVADLVRIATSGSGHLLAGQLHPDLVNRMANEAAKSAGHVLQMCIRAMDYTPPVDITFGEFLRALITADYDLVPDDKRLYRVAFIEAFRKWGIYPRDVRTLSEASLRWHAPEDLHLFTPTRSGAQWSAQARDTMEHVRHALMEWQPSREPRAWGPDGYRKMIFDHISEGQAALHEYLEKTLRRNPDSEWARTLLPGLDRHGSFSVTNLRPARRIGPDGEILTEMVFEVIQPAGNLSEEQNDSLPFRGGVTVIVALDDWRIRYTIYKRRFENDGSLNDDRNRRQQIYQQQRNLALGMTAFGAAEYRCLDEANVQGDRTVNREAMRASSCQCRFATHKGASKSVAEPFALLHRGRG